MTNKNGCCDGETCRSETDPSKKGEDDGKHPNHGQCTQKM